MEHITTFTGEDFAPLDPDINQIIIEDIAHALSLTCRANGHFTRFYSVAQHCINCADEAKARGYSDKIQLACLLHDGSEAYISDITRPVKKHLPAYLDIEENLQNKIYEKLIGSQLSGEEQMLVKQVDDDLLIWEFNALMKKKVFEELPDIKSNPSFDFIGFVDAENDFIQKFAEIAGLPFDNKGGMTKQIADIEANLKSKSKSDVADYLDKNNVSALFEEKQYIKNLSAQVDIAIHAFGILLALPQILDEEEQIEYLSLGAGNTGKPFDVATSKRIAEFKFSKWNVSHNTIRQNNIFKDFLELALYADDNGKKKYIYCYSADSIIKFLSGSRRSIESVMSRNSINKKYEDCQRQYQTVQDFYNEYKHEVEVVELEGLLKLI